MADLSGNVPRAIALIDLPELQWQVKRIGGAFGQDLTSILEALETGAAKLAAVPEPRLSFGVVYVYSIREADRPSETERPSDADRPSETGRALEADRLLQTGRVVFKVRTTEATRPCWSC